MGGGAVSGRYHAFKYTLKERNRPAVELEVQPCMRRYRWIQDHLLPNYRLAQYQNESLGAMLTVWERKI